MLRHLRADASAGSHTAVCMIWRVLLIRGPDLPKPLDEGMFLKSYRDSNHDLGNLP